MHKHLYIVEGNKDRALLKSLGAKYVVVTNGFTVVSRGTYPFIIAAARVRPIVLVLDPDGPGHQIEKRIKADLAKLGRVADLKIVHVAKKEAIRGNRVGIEKMNKEVLFSYLKSYLEIDASSQIDAIGLKDLHQLKLIGHGSAANKELLKKMLGIDISTTDNIKDSLNILGFTLEDVERILSENTRKDQAVTKDL